MKNIKNFYWNHRVIQHVYPTETYYQIHEVFYENNKPKSWTEDPVRVGGEDIKSIKWTLKMMNRCLKRPILKIVGKKRQRLVEINE